MLPYAQGRLAANRRARSAAAVGVLGPGGKEDVDLLATASAHDREDGSLTRAEPPRDEPDHVLRARDRPPVDRDDGVAAAAEDRAVELLAPGRSVQARPVPRTPGEPRV